MILRLFSVSEDQEQQAHHCDGNTSEDDSLLRYWACSLDEIHYLDDGGGTYL
jgi:hypothetical protein